MKLGRRKKAAAAAVVVAVAAARGQAYTVDDSNLPHVMPVHQDTPLLRLIEPRHQ